MVGCCVCPNSRDRVQPGVEIAPAHSERSGLARRCLCEMTSKLELTAAQCHEQAVACRSLAENVMTPPHRVMLEHIADTWERIAGDIAERGDPQLGKE